MKPKKVSLPKISVVIPFVNSERTVLMSIEKIHKKVTSFLDNAEIIAVDGLSNDNTWQILRELTHKFRELKIFRTKSPSSFGLCTLRGFRESTGALIFHIEPHCPWGAEIVWALAKEKASANTLAVFAFRKSELKSMKEKFLAKLLSDEVTEEWPLPIDDYGIGAELIKKVDFEKYHVLFHEDSVSPLLSLYIIYLTSGKEISKIYPDLKSTRELQRVSTPPVVSSMKNMRKTIEQIRKLHKDLDRIQGLLSI